MTRARGWTGRHHQYILRRAIATAALWLVVPAVAGAAPSSASHYERPLGSDGPFRDRVIVFIHGLFGDARETWTSKDGVYWPRLLLEDKAFDQSDVYVAAYDSPYSGNTMTIDELVVNLHDRLKADEVFEGHREVVFVCHSLGGIVVQQLLVTYQKEYADKVRFIYFFATPSEGSQVAALGRLLSKDPLLQILMHNDENTYLLALETQWRAAQPKTRRYCAYEKRPLKGTIIIVDRWSSTRDCDGPAKPINEDHWGIVKPNNRKHDSYVALRNAYVDNPITQKNPPPSVPPAKKASENNETAEVVQHPYDVSGKRGEKFKTLLERAPDETDTLRIGCLAGSDSACVAAGNFLILFSEAGWKIDSNKVFPMQAQIPTSGVAIAALPQQPTPADLPPHLGVWQPADKSQAKLDKAFTQMSVPLHPVGGPDLPVGTLGVYFGPDPGPQTVRLYMLLSDCKPGAESCDVKPETTKTYGIFLTTGSSRQVIHTDHPKSVHFELEASDRQFTVKQAELPRKIKLGTCADHPCTLTVLQFTKDTIVIDSRSTTFWDNGNNKMASVPIHWKSLGAAQ